MTPCEPPLIRVSNPGDLIDTVPYLIGFHPAESLVLVGFTGRPADRTQRVTVTMRVDLPLDPLADDVLLPLAEAFGSSGTDAVVAIALTAELAGDPRTLPWLSRLKDALLDDLAGIGVEVLDVLVATDTRWWSLCCELSECCPEAGTLRRRDRSVVAAEATYAGLVALPDRQSLAATLAGASIEQRALLCPAVAGAEQRVIEAVLHDRLSRLRRTETTALVTAARHFPTRQRRLSDKQAARFGVALTDTDIRDTLWLAIDDGSLDAEAILRDLHTRLPPPYDAAPLFLFGWGQWRAGNGTIATMAAERALDSDPGYSAASLLINAVQHGFDPRSTPALSEPLRAARSRPRPRA